MNIMKKALPKGKPKGNSLKKTRKSEKSLGKRDNEKVSLQKGKEVVQTKAQKQAC